MAEPKPQEEKPVELGKKCDQTKKGYKEDGFDRGLEPEKILKIGEVAGIVMFLIKFNGTEKPDMVPAAKSNAKCPRLITTFYKEKLRTDGFDYGLEPERILDISDFYGLLLIQIKWKGITNAALLSASKAEVKCPQLIIKYFKERNTDGFDRGLVPEKILGVTNLCGILLILIKWKGVEKTELVPAKKAEMKCPKLIIHFYKDMVKTDGFELGLEPDKILAFTNFHGLVLTLMKWKGIDKPSLVEATKADEKCPQLIINFYKERKINGLDRGLEPEQILDVRKMCGLLFFEIKYKGVEKTELVTITKAKLKCPELVFKFYEGKMGWVVE